MVVTEKIRKIAQDIKDIKIQGASNIELSAIEAIKEFIIEDKNKSKFVENLQENINHLVKQRPNEPKLRNSLNYILYKAYYYRLEDNNKKLIEEIKNYKENTEKGNFKVSEIASQLIEKGSKILTHCHSTLVENAFKTAHDKGVDFEVYCTETRPRYQGRITAKNLSDYGIKTTMIIDSGVSQVLKKCDYLFTGADVIFSDGSIMNKVGTHTISLMANNFKTPHIILTTTNCCEMDAMYNIKGTIETRDVNEVWEEEKRPKTLQILNPAFDIVPKELIDKFITEVGVFSPETLHLWVNQDRFER